MVGHDQAIREMSRALGRFVSLVGVGSRCGVNVGRSARLNWMWACWLVVLLGVADAGVNCCCMIDVWVVD